MAVDEAEELGLPTDVAGAGRLGVRAVTPLVLANIWLGGANIPLGGAESSLGVQVRAAQAVTPLVVHAPVRSASYGALAGAEGPVSQVRVRPTSPLHQFGIQTGHCVLGYRGVRGAG
jgi:hypothetical protein